MLPLIVGCSGTGTTQPTTTTPSATRATPATAVSTSQPASTTLPSPVPAAGNPTAACAPGQPAVTVPTGKNPRAVTLGDLNADSKPDVIVGNIDDNTITIALTTASGIETVSYPTGVKPYMSAVGDLNGDRSLDVAVANFDSGTVAISGPGQVTTALSQSAGGFGPMQTTVNAAGAYDVVIDTSSKPVRIVTAASQANTITITPFICSNA
jgi:FG-GAP-like repeat